MQTFTTSAPAEADAPTVDRMVIPFASGPSSAEDSFHIRVPLLPDNSATQYAPEEVDGPIAGPRISVVAANPETVAPVALGEVEAMGVDGVELSFARHLQPSERQNDTLSDIMKGLVDDVLSSGNSGRKLAV